MAIHLKQSVTSLLEVQEFLLPKSRQYLIETSKLSIDQIHEQRKAILDRLDEIHKEIELLLWMVTLKDATK